MFLLASKATASGHTSTGSRRLQNELVASLLLIQNATYLHINRNVFGCMWLGFTVPSPQLSAEQCMGFSAESNGRLPVAGACRGDSAYYVPLTEASIERLTASMLIYITMAWEILEEHRTFNSTHLNSVTGFS